MNAQRDDGRSAMFRTAEPSGYGRIWPDSGGLFGVLDSLVTSIEEVAGDGVIGSVLVLDDAGERYGTELRPTFRSSIATRSTACASGRRPARAALPHFAASG